jgi:hypothetical protein
MAISRGIPSVALPINPAKMHFSADEEALWRGVTRGREFSLADVTHHLLTQPLTPEQRELLEGIRDAQISRLRSPAVTHISAEEAGAGAVDAFTLPRGVPLSGESELIRRLRLRLPGSLWGQAQALEPMLTLVKHMESATRQTAPVLYMSGEPHHGQEQALSGLMKTLFDDETPAKRLVIDVSHKTDRDVRDLAKLFDDELPKLLTPDGRPNGVIVIRKANATASRAALSDRAPDIAGELARRLLRNKGDHGYLPIPWVFDFDTQGNPLEQANEAIGQLGPMIASGPGAQFVHLNGLAMEEYAKVELPRLVDAAGMAGLTLELTERATSVLGEMLATPHAPLLQLRHRLEGYLLEGLMAQTRMARGNGVFKVDLHPDVLARSDELDERALSGAVAGQHKDVPDISEGAKVFSIKASAVRPSWEEQDLVAMRPRLAELDAQLQCAAVLLPTPEALCSEFQEAVSDLRKQLEDIFDTHLGPAQGYVSFAGVPQSKLDAVDEAGGRALEAYRELLAYPDEALADLGRDLKELEEIAFDVLRKHQGKVMTW